MVFINGLEIVVPPNEVIGAGDCMQRAYESVLDEIMDFMIEGVCFESHRALKLGYYPIHDYMVNERRLERYRSMVMPEEERDIFFNDLNNEIPMSICPFCYQRKAAHTLVRHMNLCRRINDNSFDWNIRRRENDVENDINRSNVVENGVVMNGFCAVGCCCPPGIEIARNRFAVHRMENGVSENDLATNGSATNNVAANRSEMDRAALSRISMNRMIMNRIAMNRIVLNRMALNHVALSRITMNGIARNDRISFGRNDIFGNDINCTNRNDIAGHDIQENGTDDESNSDYEDYNVHENIREDIRDEEEEEEYAEGDAADDDREDDDGEEEEGEEEDDDGEEEESTDGDEEEEYTDEEEEYADAEDDSDANRENVNEVDHIIVDSVRRSAEEIIGSFARRSAEEIIGSFASRSAEEIIGSFARRSAEEMMGSFTRRSADITVVDSTRGSAEDSGSPDDLSTPDSPISDYGGSEGPLSPEEPQFKACTSSAPPPANDASSAPPPVNDTSSAPPPVNDTSSAPPPVNDASSAPSPVKRAFSVRSPDDDDHTCPGPSCDYFEFPAVSPPDMRTVRAVNQPPGTRFGNPDSPALSASALSPVPQEVYMTPATTPEHPLSPASPPTNEMSREQRDYLSRRCGVIKEKNGRPCLKSMDCPKHSIEIQSGDSNSTYETNPDDDDDDVDDKKLDYSSSDYDSLD
ncbi:hypothetical protein HNY73_021761 [Argiope bruennichi]|uniref:SCA7 domain-containing protein n=1 Tax=Argiope bruennichi TaxID=94029 RepID=A0A8T0E2A2_ARGBR|nr:hypothetical protein HNY73_021761 [Argiope bruennichi]